MPQGLSAVPRAAAALVASAVLGTVAAATPAHRPIQTDLPLKLEWADEFDQDGAPDPLNWTYERGFVRNQELQWYQPANARVAGGLLIIEARRERATNPSFDASSPDWRRNRPAADYTSASLTTRGLHAFQYGRFEMRGRIDTRAGLWPAFWTVGAKGPWPANGEIDIMEYYRGMLLANAAWAGAERGRALWDDTRTPLQSFGEGWPDRFHIWRMDWDAQTIRLYVDDRLLNDVDLTKTVNQDGSNTHPFHQPHVIILNLAVGSTGGDPSATTFPARFEVDYVRVFGSPPPTPTAMIRPWTVRSTVCTNCR